MEMRSGWSPSEPPMHKTLDSGKDAVGIDPDRLWPDPDELLRQMEEERLKRERERRGDNKRKGGGR